MKRVAPSFWYDKEKKPFWILRLLGKGVGELAAWREKKGGGVKSKSFVICVGNISVGGTGKTPVVSYFATRFLAAGKKVGIICRGYGGTLKKATLVETAVHTARQVGDEPLMLAKYLSVPVAIGPGCRPQAVALLEQVGCEVIIMDDGLQDPSVEKDVSLIVVDGAVGFGNGRVLPAGPLREKPQRALQRVDAVVIMGVDQGDVAQTVRKLAQRNHFLSPVVLSAHFKVSEASRQYLATKKVVGFCGIGRPQKFFDALEETGAELVACFSFGDHEHISEATFKHMVGEAKQKGAILVTTQKDRARLPEDLQMEPWVLDGQVVGQSLEDFFHILLKKVSVRAGVLDGQKDDQ